MPIPQLERKKQAKSKAVKQASKAKKHLKTLHKKTLTPKPGEKKDWRFYLKKAGMIALVSAAVGCLVLLGTFAWLSRQLPDPDRISEAIPVNSIKFYDRTGETVLYEKGDVIQQAVNYDDVPANLKYATLSLEDKAFYEHHGFSFIGVARAAWNNVFGGSAYTSGGSTLTQQLVKNTIVGSEKTYTRKIKELMLSLEMERKFSKDQILELYFNRIYYGRFHMGIASSAQDFFDKDVADLSLAECATLASIPRNAPYYLNNPDKLKIRRDYALEVMAEEGYITESEAEGAQAEPLAEITEYATNITAPHFVFYVYDLLVEEYGSSFTQNTGLKVTTTLDLDKQEKAVTAVTEGMTKVEQYGGSNAALVAIDAHTGQIVSMVGSKDFFAEDYDGQVNVADSLRQPGSSFKPQVYLAAFAKGYPDTTSLWDVETNFATDTGDYTPRNYDLGQRGPTTMRYALAQSLNIPAVKTLYLAGVDTVLDQAEALGYTSLSDRSRFGLALVLGGGEVTLTEHTHAFATFAREGERHELGAILKVENSEGKTLQEWKDETEQVVAKQPVRLLNDVLSDNNARAGFTALNLSDRDNGAKTGTTNDYRDAWTMGYTPSLAAGVWVGNNDNSTMNRGAAGLVVAAPIWNAYMTSVLEGTPSEEFKEPDTPKSNKAVLKGKSGEPITKKVDSLTGQIIPDECLDDYPEEYISEKEFTEAHSILYYLQKDDPLGSAPSDASGDPQFSAWEAAISRFAEENEEYLPTDEEKIDYVDCSLRDPAAAPTIKISSPEDKSELYKNEVLLEAKVTPGKKRSIVKVEFVIDDVTVDTIEYTATERTTFTSDYSPSNLTEGKHTLTVIAQDNTGTTTEESVTFSYLGKRSSSKN